MLLVAGGAYSGKRKIVRKKIESQPSTWISAYSDDSWQSWSEKWESESVLVLEGWEKWILEELDQGRKSTDIRHQFQSLWSTLNTAEQERHDPVILIMLEMGRGIVPVEAGQRMLRDVAGWILQDAARQATEVLYVWHGLSQSLKGDT